MAQTLLNFSLSCWPDINYRTCWTVVGYFILIPSIDKLVPFIVVKLGLQGVLFVEWEL